MEQNIDLTKQQVETTKEGMDYVALVCKAVDGTNIASCRHQVRQDDWRNKLGHHPRILASRCTPPRPTPAALRLS